MSAIWLLLLSFCLTAIASLHSGWAGDLSFHRDNLFKGIKHAKSPAEVLTQRVLTQRDEISAVKSSADKVISIVQSDTEDVVLAAHSVERIATLGAAACDTGALAGRRFELLAEYVDLHLPQLNTSDIARYVWGMTALGVRDLDRYDRVLQVYAARLDSMTPEDSGATDLAAVLWTAACMKDMDGPCNTIMAQGAADLLLPALASVHPADTGSFSPELYVRVIWSLAVHGIAHEALTRKCLELYFSSQEPNNASISSSVALVWSLSKLHYFDRPTISSLLQRIARFVATESVNSEGYQINFAPHREKLLDVLLLLIEEEATVGTAVTALARGLAVTLVTDDLTAPEVAGMALRKVGVIVSLLRELSVAQLDSPRVSDLIASCAARLCDAVTADGGDGEEPDRLVSQTICEVCTPARVHADSNPPANQDPRPLLSRLRRHTHWHRFLGKAAARAGLSEPTRLAPALKVAHGLALHGYAHTGLMDRLYTQTRHRLHELDVRELYSLTLALSSHCGAVPQSGTTRVVGGRTSWHSFEFKESVAMQMLCRLGQLAHPQQIAEAAIAIVHLAAAAPSADTKQMDGSSADAVAPPTEEERLAALVREAAGMGPEESPLARPARQKPPLPDWFDRGSPGGVPDRAAGAGKDEWLPEAQRRAAAGGYTLYSFEEEEGVVSDKSKLAAMVEAAATGRPAEEATAVATTPPPVAQVKLSAEQIHSLETPLLVRFLQAVRSLPPDAFDKQTATSLEEAVASAVSSGYRPDGVAASSVTVSRMEEPATAFDSRIAPLHAAADALHACLATGGYGVNAQQPSEALALLLEGTEGDATAEAHYLAGLVEGLMAERRRLTKGNNGQRKGGRGPAPKAKSPRPLGFNFFRSFV